MEDKLAILKTSIPIKAIPEDSLDKLFDAFCLFITDLLTLKGDSARKLIQTLPAIKKHCWSMGFEEVVKMFTMYADGELNLQPRSNYLDRVLVGQIFNAYKQQKPIKVLKITEMTQEEKDFKMVEATDRVRKEFKQHGRIIEMCHHVYDYLFELGKLPKDKAYKDAIFAKAMELRKSELIQERAVNYSAHKETKDLLKDINKGNAVINIAKRLVLEEYFKNKQNE